MTSDNTWFEDADDELTDDEYPDQDSMDDDLSQTAPCTNCGAEIYEDSVRCPVCGTYVTGDTNPWVGRPKWWILLGVLGVVAAVVALAGLATW
jgi:hypothetical protein